MTPDINPVEFDGFRMQAGLNSFILTAKQWIEKTNAIGIVSKSGKNIKKNLRAGETKRI